MNQKFKNLFILLRPLQWTKNTLVFATFIFNGDLFNLNLFFRTSFGFLLFCLISSCVYIINDINDCKRDKLHPLKSKRPLASGGVTILEAKLLLFIILFVTLPTAYFFSKYFFLTILIFFFLNLIYTFGVKNVEILELIFISFGYVLRTFAGVILITLNISYWILVCSGLIALFVILIKRKQEYILAEQHNNFAFRPLLKNYSLNYLDKLINITAAATIIAYGLYTFASHKGQQIPGLAATIPFVVYGIFRYLYLVDKRNFGGEPEQVFLNDLPLIICIVLWAVFCGFLIALKGNG